MTDWADLDTAMDTAAFRDFGDDAVYRVSCTGSGQAVRVIITEESQRIGEGGYVDVRSEIQIKQSDLPSPRKGDCMTVSGVTWLVDDIQPRKQRWLLVVRKGG